MSDIFISFYLSFTSFHRFFFFFSRVRRCGSREGRRLASCLDEMNSFFVSMAGIIPYIPHHIMIMHEITTIFVLFYDIT